MSRCPKATTVTLKQENAFARQVGVGRPGQNLAPAGKDPRDRREEYRSEWGGINPLERQHA
jgi:hypothetical protein